MWSRWIRVIITALIQFVMYRSGYLDEEMWADDTTVTEIFTLYPTLQTTISSRIVRRAEQGTRPSIHTRVAVEKLTTELNSNSNPKSNSKSKSNSNSIRNNSLVKAKRGIHIATFNVRTIKKIRTF